MENKSILYICISIIIGFSILSISLFLSNEDNNRYEMLSPNENNIIIFDSKTGDYYRKFIESEEGPTDWTRESINFLEK